MITRSEETIELLRDRAVSGGRLEQADLACELLSWLNANHFTFLGYREYEVVSDQSGVSVQGSSRVPALASCAPIRTRRELSMRYRCLASNLN